MTKDLYNTLEAYMIASMDDSAHDKEHVYRVLYNALEIAKAIKGQDAEITLIPNGISVTVINK